MTAPRHDLPKAKGRLLPSIDSAAFEQAPLILSSCFFSVAPRAVSPPTASKSADFPEKQALVFLRSDLGL